ncbi:MAG: exo-alpha-sialidase [Myxococcales bacterium]|nr:exo-alpha-sialidase [Myxococcales bacterium]
MRASPILLVLGLFGTGCDDDESGVGGGTTGTGTDQATGSSPTGSGPSTTTTGSGSSSSTGGPLPPDPCIAAGTCPPGEWINVTPAEMDPSVLAPTPNAFGPGSIVGDPARPNEMYVAGSSAGLWKTEDYGNTWFLVNHTLPDIPRGVLIAVAGTTPATIWIAGHLVVYKSVDAGQTFSEIPVDVDLYSLRIDPYDNDHLVSGLHEADGLAESTDGGATWSLVGGAGFPAGGVSWYPFFIDTGDAATTRDRWIAIPQNGGGAVLTTDGGATWAAPPGLAGLTHGHGNCQIHQTGDTLFVAGTDGPSGNGVYRSTDLGDTWSLADAGNAPQAIVWGTPNNVYSMWAWACSKCDLGTNFQSSPLPGTSWAPTTHTDQLQIGPNSLVVTSDGTHQIFVGLMWSQGLWRYIEP